MQQEILKKLTIVPQCYPKVLIRDKYSWLNRYENHTLSFSDIWWLIFCAPLFSFIFWKTESTRSIHEFKFLQSDKAFASSTSVWFAGFEGILISLSPLTTETLKVNRSEQAHAIIGTNGSKQSWNENHISSSLHQYYW